MDSERTLPKDEYSTMLRSMRANPAAVEKASTIDTADFYGNAETWTVRTIRVEGNDVVFLQRDQRDRRRSVDPAVGRDAGDCSPARQRDDRQPEARREQGGGDPKGREVNRSDRFVVMRRAPMIGRPTSAPRISVYHIASNLVWALAAARDAQSLDTRRGNTASYWIVERGKPAHGRRAQ